MRIRIGYDIAFNFPAPTAMLLMLHLHPSRATSVVRPEHVTVEPSVPMEEYTDSFGNQVGRVVAPAGAFRITNDAVVTDDGRPDPVSPDAGQDEVGDLPAEVLQFLLPSRYCEVDRLGDFAWGQFGRGPTGWGRVQAVCDWVHDHVRFDYAQARPTKTAFDVFVERQGVCRDFTHLAVSLCRCLNIPARYATGYLGDIGVPAAPFPMDFSAWFEAYLGGRWHTFDARHNTPRVGRVLMARGRDAVDVALTTSFGPTTLTRFFVRTDLVDETA